MTNLNHSENFTPKLLVLDLDGTLANTAPDICICLNDTMRDYGLPEYDLDTVVSFIGHGTKNLIENAIPKGFTGDINEFHQRFLHNYATNTVNKTSLYPGVIELLQNSNAKLAVLTNKPISPTTTLLNYFDIKKYFMAIIGGDSDIGRKPDPAPLNEIMRLAGVKPQETLMIGDGDPDIDVAKAAGIRCCIFGQGFGDTEVLKAKQPDYFYENFKDFTEDYFQGKL